MLSRMETTLPLKLPPKNYRRIIEELSVAISDPALKLKFLKQAINEHQSISAPYKLYPALAEIAFRKILLDKAESIWPGSKKAIKDLIRRGVISAPHTKLWRLYKFRHVIAVATTMLFVCGLGTSVASLVGNFNTLFDLKIQRFKASDKKIIGPIPINFNPPSGRETDLPSPKTENTKLQNRAEPFPKNLKNSISLVEKTFDREIYSKPADVFQPSPKEIDLPTSKSKTTKLQNVAEQLPEYAIDPIRLVEKTSDRKIYSEPIEFLQPSGKETDLPSSKVKAPNHQNRAEPFPKNLKNSISLVEKTSDREIYSKPADVLNPPSREIELSILKVKTTEPQNRAALFPEYSKDPMWLMEKTSDREFYSEPIDVLRPPSMETDLPISKIKTASHQNRGELFPKYLKDPIWLVEKTSDREIYSNRLQIITTHTVDHIPRKYCRFPRNSNQSPADIQTANKISGIVYHASESDLFPFTPEMNTSIKKYTGQLIKYLQRQKSYHYLIDRFGRVYRLIADNHVAFHAGNSVWADDEEIYLNLNHAFIGICFEGKDFEETENTERSENQTVQSKSPRLRPTGISSFNNAQLRSGKELTDWLRVKYNIPQNNCVPHAIISVNPKDMLIGFHLDLSRGFPFAKFGLSNKYLEPLPSIVEFGFHHDRYFKKIFDGDIWPGIRQSEEILQRQARDSGMSLVKYRSGLHQKFTQYAQWEKKMVEKKDHLVEKPQKKADDDGNLG